MNTADNMETSNRQILRDIMQGGSGEVEGVIYTLPQPDGQPCKYYIIQRQGTEAIRCIVDTEEQAQKLLHIKELNA